MKTDMVNLYVNSVWFIWWNSIVSLDFEIVVLKTANNRGYFPFMIEYLLRWFEWFKNHIVQVGYNNQNFTVTFVFKYWLCVLLHVSITN